MDALLSGAMWYVIFLFSTTLHEAAHAWSAMRMGDATAYHAGQVTMDPIPHIEREPIGTVLVPLLSYAMLGWMMGWASAPYNPMWARRYPKKAAYMALAGPISNLLLVFVAAAFIHLGLYLEVFYAPEKIQLDNVVAAYDQGLPTTLANLVSILFVLNLVLFLFNMLPLPPLDGSRLFPLFMENDTAQRIMDTLYQPGVMLVGLFAAWFLFDAVFGHIHLAAINLLFTHTEYGFSY